jgi:hypothetical protein
MAHPVVDPQPVIARGPPPSYTTSVDSNVAAAHQVRGSAHKGAFVHILSPVESRRVVGADAFSSAR